MHKSNAADHTLGQNSGSAKRDSARNTAVHDQSLCVYLAEVHSIGLGRHSHLVSRSREVHEAWVEVLTVVLHLSHCVTTGVHRDEQRCELNGLLFLCEK